MSKGYTPEVPAIPAKIWCTCDGCGLDSPHLEKDMMMWDVTPVGWAAFTIKNDSAEYIVSHFCADCIPTITVRGIKLYGEAVEILGEDYFQ